MNDKITGLRHPHWTAMADKWFKWRLTYCGGDEFIEHYTQKFSAIEDPGDFKNRKKVTPSPSFAKSAVNEIKNSIFQRMADVARRGGSKGYEAAVLGKENGVDLHGKSMSQYLGMEVLPELLTMARVGVFVDMPPLPGPTMAAQQGLRPYLYTYRAEEITSWSYRKDRVDEFQAIMLQDYVDLCCPKTGLPKGTWCRWRHIYLSQDDGQVHVQVYNNDCEMCSMDGDREYPSEYIIPLDFIPFVMLEINDSLLSDVANHQIALLNLESADVAYALKANVPLYTEQSDNRMDTAYARGPADGGATGASEEAAQSRDKSIKVGVTQGRRYGPNMERPGFIHPSSEPLKASMEKQKNLKDDIRQLVNLALSNVKSKMASAESKAIDERGLEAGLSHIGLVLEHAENKIARYWASYEGDRKVATVSYPKNYSLQTDADRRQEVESLEDLRDAVPSVTFQKAVSKRMVEVLLGGKESTEVIDKIKAEIESAETITAAIEHIKELVDSGICSKELAEKILGFPKGTVEAADEEHARRAAAIAQAQAEVKAESDQNAAARGTPDLSADPKGAAAAEKSESRSTDLKASTESRVRGEGK